MQSQWHMYSSRRCSSRYQNTSTKKSRFAAELTVIIAVGIAIMDWGNPGVLASIGICSAIFGFYLGRFQQGSAMNALKIAGNVARQRSVRHQMCLLVRKDLKMGKGKQAAQCAHATLGAYRRAVRLYPEAVWAWETFGQAKIAVQVENEQEMMEVKAQAEAAGICTYVVEDAGRTQVEPGSRTVMAVGPAEKTLVDSITRHLKLL
uniref:peptidyl-tRNA hydrolase n=1 Tax=Spongospora subterranea TaxID=70186 RepID=A0A0H5QIP0_9EUKA|eukprot:CRZ01181.1 hypothetical protein [Spongospora subterranea]